jgi:cell shape-determining protein MreD
MRLKLVFIISSLAALIGAGGSTFIILGILSTKSLSSVGPLAMATLALPVLAVLLASFFVYRHTAKRRKLQAFLTAILTTLLCICIFLLASLLTARRNSTQPPAPVGPSAKQ